MLIAVGVDVVGAAKIARFLRAALRPKGGMESLADDFAVQDIGDLKISECESVNGRLHFVFRCRGHPDSSCRQNTTVTRNVSYIRGRPVPSRLVTVVGGKSIL
jgi:hypothetical protein